MVDAITRAVIQKRLENIAEEMSIVLKRTAYSPNIKERSDFSCAIFTSTGELIAQAEAIPVHLGSMPSSVEAVIHSFQTELEEGDAIIHNSPYRGGTHLPDITMILPVFYKGELLFYLANRAHHADVGGITPGSLPGSSTEVFQEGLIIPPVRLYRKGAPNTEIMALVLENVRTPHERKGDFAAQYAALRKGEERIHALLTEFSPETVIKAMHELLSITENAVRSFIKSLPSTPMHFTDYLDNDGISEEPVQISCTLSVTPTHELVVDFTGTSPQRKGNCNSPISVTASALYYVIRCLLDPHIPTNAGLFRPLRLIAPRGTLVNPVWPAAVSSANTETSQRIVDVIWGALATALDHIPAASQGTMNNILIGSASQQSSLAFSYYETIAGGAGASKFGPGESAVHTGMTNTQNTPIEALELAYPLQVLEYSIRSDSGGKGKYKGGDGVIRAIKVLTRATLSIQSERRVFSPWGLQGGSPGKSGINLLIRPNGKEVTLPSKVTLDVEPGSIIRVYTPGGGGWGSP